MMKALKKVNWKKLGIFAGGVLFGTAGIKVLSSKDALLVEPLYLTIHDQGILIKHLITQL